MKKILFISIITIGVVAWFFSRNEKQPSMMMVSDVDSSITSQVAEKTMPTQPVIKMNDRSQEVAEKFIDLNVPFVLQAPFANWEDPIFQNACEEASIIMAMGWLNGIKNISAEEANKQILKMVKFEDEKFGYNTDTDVFDVKIIFENYFKYKNISITENISLENIKNEIQKNNLIIVPVFGRALNNPNYSGAGPVVHMLVVKGYDPKSGEFITNDPGTKKGNGYRYNEDVLFSAIWSYPSGKDTPDIPTGKMKKAMLIVRK
jgi:hypothetical protein